ncbi:MAG: single-stranded-DNA-specific exonuclease RecJ [Flavobacteriales bacterium]|nr:single-stranded-DNA-specific exonuclease RecJ [Flavobacteriales bacterium]
MGKLKRWRLVPEVDNDLVQALVHDRCPERGARILVQRGIKDHEQASVFFRPSLDQLHDPFLMADMRKAVERIEEALAEKQRIMVYGDYDVDGTTAVALVYSFLQKFTSNICFYIPDRYAEGYGISTQGIDHAKSEGVALIIALDCGIKSIDKVEYANSKGVDFIICDHHRPGDKLPAAVAVLDPKRNDCNYPFKELSGCGVGFKLMQALAQNNNMPFSDLEPLLDLVAVSTACDIVPVNGENRVLAHFGLLRLNSMPRPGIKAMLDMSNAKRTQGITDLVFSIGPRINAAGRIEHGSQAVELLLAKQAQQAAEIGNRVDVNNTQRQVLDKDITREALEHIDDLVTQDGWSTVVFQDTWHKGVIGIVASRLIEKHYKPTVVLTESNGMAVGSARSVKGFDVYEAINACSDLLEQFGGHMYAAGLSMPLENVDAFKKKFEDVVRNTMDPELRIPEEVADLELRLKDLDKPLVGLLHYMAPYGPGICVPCSLIRGLVDRGRARIVGEDHVKMELAHPQDPKLSFDAIGFKLGHHFEMIKTGKPFSVLCTLEENEWNGQVKMQLNVKDIKPGILNLLVGEGQKESAIGVAGPA